MTSSFTHALSPAADIDALTRTELAQNWPVPPALEELVPGGLPRGGTVVLEGAVSLVLATLGAASTAGAWCALAGLPPLSAETACAMGVVMERTPIVSAPAPQTGRAWASLISALLDAMDVVVARPRVTLAATDLSRLAARARAKDATLLVYAAAWPGADLRISAKGSHWQRARGPQSRLTARSITITAQGRGRFARPRNLTLLLPDWQGGVAPAPQDEPSRLTAVR